MWRECNFSLRWAGEVLGMPSPLLSKWGKEVAMIRAAIRAERRAKKRKTLLDGPAGQLAPIKEELLCFAFEKRKQGINVKHMLVACRASGMLCQIFGPKSINAKVKA